MVRARRVAGSMLALLALLATACPKAAPVTTATPSVVPSRGGTLVLNVVDDLEALDPHLATTPVTWAVARALHRGLYAYPDLAGRQGTVPIPDLALGAPVVAADQRSATIRITPAARFHDGSPVTAADVVASLERLATSGRGIGPVFAAALRSATVREGTVQIVSALPIRRLLKLLAHPQAAIVPARTGAIRKARAPIGAGPYQLGTREGARLPLVRHDRAASDPIRPAYADRIEITVGGRAVANAVVLDPGPPDLIAPSAPEDGIVVATLCVRYLDLSFTKLSAAQRVAVGRAITRLAEIGTGPVATVAVPPVLQATPAPRPSPAKVATTPRFDLVVSSSPRDQAEGKALRAVLPAARVRTVAPGALYGGAPVGSGAQVRTWCADWPDAAAMTGSPATAATAIPLWWPTESVRVGAEVRGFVGSPMFPRGDPTALWIREL